MQSKIVTITPKIASEYLKFNISNRPIRKKFVDHLANEFLKGKYIMSHQGIAFSEDGYLIDGQHRLLAIVKSGVTVDMLVSEGVVAEAFSVIDTGEKRQIGDELSARYGIKSAHRICAIINKVAFLCLTDTYRATIGSSLNMYYLLKESIDNILSVAPDKGVAKKSSVTGTLVLCHTVYPDEIKIFSEQVALGEALQRNDPAFVLRDFLFYKKNIDWIIPCYATATAAKNFICNKQLNRLVPTMESVNFFKNKNKNLIAKIKKIYGVE